MSIKETSHQQEPASFALKQRPLALKSKRKGQGSTTASVQAMVRRVVESGLITLKEVRSLWSRLRTDRKPQTGAELGRELVKQGMLTPFQIEAISQGKESSLILGKYTVLDKLGQGGTGTVLRAKHRVLNRLVALKLLSVDSTQTLDSVQRFKREMIVGAKLDHPNIVAVYDADEADDAPFLVMQLVDGRYLASLVHDEGPLPVETAIDYVVQAARGLQHAHAEGIVHRDIKPSNLLLDRWGTIKVVDFGLARVVSLGDIEQKGAHLTRTGTIMGTADYMPPEQALNTKEADHRADIYSLGAVLHFLLTGQPPYAGKTVIEKLVAHRDSPIPSLQHKRGDVSPALQAVVEGMLAKQADQRFQSMTAVITALESCLGVAPGMTRDPMAPPLPSSISPLREKDQVKAFLQGLGDATGTDTTANLQPNAPGEFAISIEPDTKTIFSQDKQLPFSPRAPKTSQGRARARSTSAVRGLMYSIRSWCS